MSRMIQSLRKKYALSESGARDMVKACVSVTLSNFCLMFPAGILYTLIKDLLEGTLTRERIPFYAVSSAVILLLIALTNFIQYNATFLSTYKESGVRRRTLADVLRKLPLSFFGKRDLSDLTTAMMADCAMIETASSHWIPELNGALISTSIIGLSLFIFFDWRMALASFWVIPVSVFIVVSTKSVQARAVKKNHSVKLDLENAIQEDLETMRDLKSSGAEGRYLNVLKSKIKRVEKQALSTEIVMAVYVSSAQMILKLGIATTALVGGVLLAKGEISVLTFFMFLMVVSRLYDPLQIMLQNFAAITAMSVQVGRLNEILFAPMQKGSEELSNKGYDISFEDVDFSYSDGVKILNKVSFTAKQGEVTALVGPSGSGKTTLSRLAARFWDISDGKISVGGMDISKADPEKLLSMYSIVFQDVLLFNNTVKENIRIGKKDATDEEVMSAARLANCMDFVEKLPSGFDTMIGENGSELSGGERQRLSIARAFLKDAPIILLDEATASLDAENETEIQEALSKLLKDKTVLIIAHRLRTISKADHVVVLSDGKIAEEGKPAELVQKGGIFARMSTLQHEGENWKLNG